MDSDVDMAIEDEEEDELILKPQRERGAQARRAARTREEEEDEEDVEDDQDDEEEEEEAEDDDDDDDNAEGETVSDDDDDDDDEEEVPVNNPGVSQTPSPLPQRPRLKIRLRLPVHPSSSSNTASTPARTGTPEVSRSSSRREPSADFDVESEDEHDLGGDKDPSQSTPSTSLTPSSRPMTTRQAVLASVVDSTHVSLSETSRKKKLLNDAELALRREETARKRRNLTEKKLEDEKAETINRLLKKQSRPKHRRTALSSHADDRTPHSASLPPTNTNTRTRSTPVPPSLLRDVTMGDSNGNGDESAVRLETSAAMPVLPVMYRWISTSKTGPGEEATAEKRMRLSLSVPVNAIGTEAKAEQVGLQAQPRADSRCDVEGCTELRKYRLVKDWTRGACGMSHLTLLDVSQGGRSAV